MRVLAARAGARLRAVGLRPQRIDIARPAGGRRVGLGGRRLAMAPNALVVGYRGAAAPTPLDQAIEAARRRLGAPLQIEGGRVLAAGTLMAELSGPGRRYLLRLAGPANAASQARAEATLEGLLACGAPSSVRERLVAPLARGRVGPMRWSLEPRRPGSHPAAVDERLWQSCLEFLIGLRSTPVPPSAPLAAAFSDDVRVLERHIDVPARRTLSELERRLVDRLGSLDRAWGHGDFHPGNLLVDRGTLDSVLDWDAAHPAALPLLDVLHLSVTAEPRSRRLSHGARCSDELWPLARAGGDARIRAYCAATETPGEPATLLALSEAYWLTRVARDLREFSDRARRDEWLELNLRRPLREIRSS
jgi:aminoglycoside phosphotransferase (APT) family kinase protein